jgi:ribosomal protein L32
MERQGDECLKTINFLFLLLLLYSIFLNTSFVVGAVSPLNLTVATDKPAYLQGESVEVSGTLSLGVSPLVGWLVAVSINTPNGVPLTTTLVTDQDGNFATTFNLPLETELGTYTVLSSVQWADQQALQESPFEIKSTEQTGAVQPQVPQEPPLSPSSPVLLTLIAIVVAFSLIILALIFYGLVTYQEKVKAPVTPVTPTTPVRKVKIMRYKTCAKCGRTFLGVHTFCPHCFTYHGKNGYTEKITA